MKCVPGLTVRRLCGHREREIDICEKRNADAEQLTGNGGKRRKLEWPPGRIVKLE